MKKKLRFGHSQIAVLTLLLVASMTAFSSFAVSSINGITRPLAPTMLTGNGINYSPFRTGNRDTETIDPRHLKEDLSLLVRAGFNFIRVFDSSDERTKKTLELIRSEKVDLKVILGIHIQGNHEVFNKAEIKRGIKLANDFKDIVIAVSVANETLIPGSPNPVKPDLIIEHLKNVRAQISQPITTSDVWLYFSSAPKKLFEKVDFVSMHSYPFIGTADWDWKRLDVAKEKRAAAMMDGALSRLKLQFGLVKENVKTTGFPHLPVIIGETGWKAHATDKEKYRAHPANQKMYYDRLMDWQSLSRKQPQTGPSAIIWFQAFDEHWKREDDAWGLFTIDRKARFALHKWFEPSEEDGTKFSEQDALFYSP
jgi:exo-beta-1,3-glucanase (GH17 family)